jgi:glycosyltransferase involved in cell wall biosynthesis
MLSFDLRGDCAVPLPSGDVKVSCVINFYGRLDLLRVILHSLAGQKYPRELFEVLLVEDRGGTADGAAVAEEFSHLLSLRYAPLPEPYGLMGHSRNYGLSLTKGDIVLLLDDDTVILQDDFLDLLVHRFEVSPEASAVIPHGLASFALIQGRYDFHDPYFMTSRCTAYRRDVLMKLGGFISAFIGQEDVEFVTRFFGGGYRSIMAPELTYYHPPLLVGNLRKPMAVGKSFASLRGRYPFVLWLLALMNCARHAPLYLVPCRKFREMGRFGVGFIAGVFVSLFNKEGFRYS